MRKPPRPFLPSPRKRQKADSGTSQRWGTGRGVSQQRPQAHGHILQPHSSCPLKHVVIRACLLRVWAEAAEHPPAWAGARPRACPGPAASRFGTRVLRACLSPRTESTYVRLPSGCLETKILRETHQAPQCRLHAGCWAAGAAPPPHSGHRPAIPPPRHPEAGTTPPPHHPAAGTAPPPHSRAQRAPRARSVAHPGSFSGLGPGGSARTALATRDIRLLMGRRTPCMPAGEGRPRAGTSQRPGLRL